MLSQKLMKKITVPNDKKIGFYKAFDHKRYQWYESEDSSQAFGQKLSVFLERKTSKIRSCPKKSTLPVKKSR